MKKLVMLSMIALAALGFIGCGSEDGTKADIKWTNTPASVTIDDITWVNSGKVDQTWNGNFPPTNAETEFKGVTELVGYGECFIGGVDAEIQISGSSIGIVSTDGSSATIAENAAANLLITNAAKK